MVSMEQLLSQALSLNCRSDSYIWFCVLLNVFWSIKSTGATGCEADSAGSWGGKGSGWESLVSSWHMGGREVGFTRRWKLAMGGPPLGGPYNSSSQLLRIRECQHTHRYYITKWLCLAGTSAYHHDHHQHHHYVESQHPHMTLMTYEQSTNWIHKPYIILCYITLIYSGK